MGRKTEKHSSPAPILTRLSIPIASLFMFICFYFPVGFFRNAAAAGQGAEPGALMFLLIWQFMIFMSTFAHMCISFADTSEMGGNIANFFFMLIFFFCGVLATPDAMPRFWIFLYRVSPLSYWISAVLSTGLANVEVTCSASEYAHIIPPSCQICGEYMAECVARAGGCLLDPDVENDCSYCKIRDTNAYLSAVSSKFGDRWRNFGILWAFVVFNIVAALVLHWAVRMPKGKKRVAST
ncbi:ABC-2 type transporter-domain-containing protein [Cadophora sp. MPI-SDFR-AT-0126]|nr:ABC-2 type transporter-domain-containing protein [Leotiomycetes sp. MPI-SDFR-AT-0126]